MAFKLHIFGIVIIVIGVFIGIFFYGGVALIAVSIICGIFFMALGKIVELLEKIEQKLPDLSNSNTYQVQEYSVTSSDFDVYDSSNETYQFLTLDGNDYIQARVFKNYLDIKENTISFKLPSRVQQVFTKHDTYRLSVDVFSKDDIVFVKLASLGIHASQLGNSIVLSYSITIK
ncbi:hypothetical protein SAMN03159341_11935 [Paenibacillus sp. 1_12]|uniref:hypothetical protein n=1 Tax=Paenibacillus sp. 1_12 TaxID=1566278 RepID=UPI0008EDC4AA|nr:hypothetical protein [Paenibacillus sp. 1_12]SFM17409.1 hypothetical protein SAMN03159341_11935 [Paenibacillus sp. 1_12]